MRHAGWPNIMERMSRGLRDMIKTLLITGANNHDWKRSAPFCTNLLEATGLFDVDITEDPSEFLKDADRLKRYGLFLLDYNGPDWSGEAKANFIAAVENGTGLASIHASNNAFIGWSEFEEMLGLLWRDGCTHGRYHEFKVAVSKETHPITAGMNDFMICDELYAGLMNAQKVPYTVLATAYSIPEQKGSGRDEPAAIVLEYGKGRVFQLILGHTYSNMPGGPLITFENADFQRLLIRGCEWAATGNVTFGG
jgi:type 1 glutamine amidotransferase